MKDFKSFRKPTEEMSTEELIDAYKGKKESDIFAEIYRKALEGKKNGTLTNEQIDAFTARILPMLDAKQRKKLKAVAEKLKQI